MPKKYVHLSKEIIDICCKVKHGIVWAYLCTQDKHLSIEEISSHYNLSLKKVKEALEGMIEHKAIVSEIVDGTILYRANPETYYQSDES